MAHLQNSLLPGRQIDQLTRLVRGLRNGLLDQHVGAGVQEVLGDLKMSRCLRGHADGINRSEQLAVVGDRAHRELSSDLIARLLPRVRHRYELAISGLRVFLGVKAAEVADSDDCCSDFFHHTGIMPRPGACLAPPSGRSGRRSRSSTLLDLLARARNSFAPRSRMGRELIIFGSALLFGLICVPLAIWFVGNRVLGPYTHGTNPNAGPLALLGDFFIGLTQGWLSYWIVALGPAVLILLARLAWALIKFNLRSGPSASKDRL